MNIKIPVAMQIRVDDVGWHNGADERIFGRPSRSGLPRKHHYLDYPILNEIGKALDTKVCCSLVLGEWDKDNLLRGEKNMTYDLNGWDRASEIDMNYAERAFDYLENSEYIAYTLHSVLHGFYHNDKLIAERVYNPPAYDAQKDEYIKGQGTHLSESEFKRQIDTFFKIYNSWGFKKPVTSFACPCGSMGIPEDEGNQMYGKIIGEYGIDVWQNGWWTMVGKSSCGVAGGAVCLRGGGAEYIPWEAYDFDPDYLPLFNTEDSVYPLSDICVHWTNLIRYNPEKNLEYLPKWVSFFKKQAEVFGVMMSRDAEFAASQAIYNKYAKLSVDGSKCIIDLSDVDKAGVRCLKNKFYISFKNGVAPISAIGGTISEYESKKNFKTYKIVRDNNKRVEIKILIV